MLSLGGSSFFMETLTLVKTYSPEDVYLAFDQNVKRLKNIPLNTFPWNYQELNYVEAALEAEARIVARITDFRMLAKKGSLKIIKYKLNLGKRYHPDEEVIDDIENKNYLYAAFEGTPFKPSICFSYINVTEVLPGQLPPPAQDNGIFRWRDQYPIVELTAGVPWMEFSPNYGSPYIYRLAPANPVNAIIEWSHPADVAAAAVRNVLYPHLLKEEQ
jgi:hypothetical protein